MLPLMPRKPFDTIMPRKASGGESEIGTFGSVDPGFGSPVKGLPLIVMLAIVEVLVEAGSRLTPSVVSTNTMPFGNMLVELNPILPLHVVEPSLVKPPFGKPGPK